MLCVKRYIFVLDKEKQLTTGQPTKLSAMQTFNEIIEAIKKNPKASKHGTIHRLRAMKELNDRQEEFGLVHQSVLALYYADNRKEFDAAVEQLIKENEWHMAMVFEQWAEA